MQQYGIFTVHVEITYYDSLRECQVNRRVQVCKLHDITLENAEEEARKHKQIVPDCFCKFTPESITL